MIHVNRNTGIAKTHVSNWQKQDGKLYQLRMLEDSSGNVFVSAEDVLKALGHPLAYRNIALHCLCNNLDLVQIQAAGLAFAPKTWKMYSFTLGQILNLKDRYKHNPSSAELVQHIMREYLTVFGKNLKKKGQIA